MQFYEFSDYRDLLKVRIDEKRVLLAGYNYQDLAKACRVQKAYLSRVFRHDADLSQDQLYLACEFLGLHQDQRRFVFVLHELCRSTLLKRRAELQSEIEDLRTKALGTERHIRTKSVSVDAADRLVPYFLDPDVQLVHMFLTVKRYRENLEDIRSKLSLSPAQLSSILTTLERLELVAIRGNSIEVLQDALHLPTSSELFRPYRLLLRNKVLAKMQSLPSDQGQFISVVFSASHGTERTIRERFLQVLRETEDQVRESRTDRVYQMTFDLFSWSD